MAEKMKAALDRMLSTVCIAILIGITILICIQIVSRYVFNNPIGWTEEIARHLQPWLTFLGIPLGFLTLSHIAIGFLPSVLTGKRKLLLTLFVYGAVVYLNVVMFVKGIVLAKLNWDVSMITVNVSQGVALYLFLPISAVLTIVSLILNVMVLTTKSKTQGEVT
jgi:TRAP-type C4-dicarboxylate transport system permease small subunit